MVSGAAGVEGLAVSEAADPLVAAGGGVVAAGFTGSALAAGAGAGFSTGFFAAGFFFDGLAARLAASRSIVPITFSPGPSGPKQVLP